MLFYFLNIMLLGNMPSFFCTFIYKDFYTYRHENLIRSEYFDESYLRKYSGVINNQLIKEQLLIWVQNLFNHLAVSGITCASLAHSTKICLVHCGRRWLCRWVISATRSGEKVSENNLVKDHFYLAPCFCFENDG